MQRDSFAIINIDQLISSKLQNRKNYNEDSIKELALSIKEVGIIEPIIVRKAEDKYEIIAGERRVKAAKLIGLKEVPAIIKDLSDELAYKTSLVENIQRDNVSPVEEAKSFEKIMNSEKIEEADLSQKIGKSELTITNKLKLLSLSEKVQEAITQKLISEKHARILLKLDSPIEQEKYLDRIIKEKLTIKELNNIINIKKEEKESDSMNNDNFFPNQNYNQPIPNNTTLNAINQQAMAPNNQMPTSPAPQAVEQTFDPNIIQFPMNNAQQEESPILTPPIAPTMDNVSLDPINIQPTETPINMENNNLAPSEPTIMPQVNELVQQPTEVNTQPTENNNIINDALSDIPLFATENNTVTSTETSPITNEMPAPENPINNDVITPVEPVITPPTPEESAPSPIPVFETSVTPEPVTNEEVMPALENNSAPVNVPITAEEDKLTILTEFLNEKGISFKQYSNETNKCIIIEL